MNEFIEELKRRHVFRMALLYLAFSWLLLQVADVLIGLLGLPDWALRFVFLLLALGLPAALVFAWVFEVTPDGLRRESELERHRDRDAALATQTGEKLDRAVVGVVLVALAALFLDRFVLPQPNGAVSDPARVARGRSADPGVGLPVAAPTSAQEAARATREASGSIAVLPFVNNSADQANEYFSDGVTEELLNRLVKIGGLRVASRRSSFWFKGRNLPLREIAAELGVDYVVAGSVRKAGDRVRVSAQLIEVASDQPLWSDAFDRRLEDIFAVQDEIALRIAEALIAMLAGAGIERPVSEPIPTSSLEAYDLYLQGRELWSRRSGEAIGKAIERFEAALALDPSFARASASLAAALITYPSYAREPSYGPWFLRARETAERALMLDDSLGEAHAVIAETIREFERDWLAAERRYLRAIASEPSNATARLWYCEMLVAAGRLSESVPLCESAHSLDPVSAGTNSILASLNYILGNDTEAVRYDTVAHSLGNPWDGPYELLVALRQGDYETARAVFAAIEQDVPEEARIGGAWVDAAEDPSRVRRFVELIPRVIDEPRAFNDRAMAYAHAGDFDRAFLALKEGLELAPGTVYIWQFSVLWTPELAPLRRQPRFGEILERLGLVEYWLETRWADRCRPEGDRVVCF